MDMLLNNLAAVFLMGNLQRSQCSASCSLSFLLLPSSFSLTHSLSLFLSPSLSHTHIIKRETTGNDECAIKSELVALTVIPGAGADTARGERRKKIERVTNSARKQLGAKEECSNTNTLNSGLIQKQGHQVKKKKGDGTH